MFNNLLGKIAVIVTGVAALIGSAFIPAPQPESLNQIDEVQQNLGTAIPTPVAFFETSLASKILSTDLTMTLVSTSTKSGSLTTGKVYGFVIDEGSADEEIVVGTLSGSDVVSMTRGVDPVTGNTNVPALQKIHRRGASVKITDAPVILVTTRILNGDETLPNILRYDSPKTFTASSSLVDKNYADGLVIAAGVSATDVLPGISLIGTNTGFGTATGTYGGNSYYKVPNMGLFNTTSSATTTVPVTKSNGKLSQGFLDLTEAITFSGTTTITNSVGIMPVGVIMPYSTTTAPSGWLIANGTAYSTSTYSSLFSVIGYAYGSSTGNFKVPDLRGRTIFGVSTSSSDFASISTSGGRATSSDIVEHTHTITSNNSDNSGGGGRFSGSNSSSPVTISSNGVVVATGLATTSPTTGSNILNPYMTLQYIIKY